MTQQEALTILKTGANVFLTGEPGSGKTHVVNAYTTYLKEHGVEVAITASTGIAATHIGGMTVHAFSGIGVRDSLTPYDLDQITTRERVVKRISAANVLIIDEVSMLDGRILDMIEEVCRAIRKRAEPFGGLQVVLVGDFFQLPPVAARGSESRFAFESRAWGELSLLTCYLTEQYRQEDETLLNILSAFRRGEIDDLHMEILMACSATTFPEHIEPTRLYTHNADVDRINGERLVALSTPLRTFTMEEKGNKQLVEGLKKSCLSPDILELREGAMVMCTKNNFDAGFANGTLGRIVRFEPQTGYPVVETFDKTEIAVAPMEWRIEEDKKVLAEIRQIPLRLAWAITVHKSQGMSLDAAEIDLSSAFEFGQGYVALSRVRSLRGLLLHGCNEKALRVHPRILEIDGSLREQSDDAGTMFAELPKEEIGAMHERFILASGGSLTPNPQAALRTAKEKVSTAEKTRELLMKGMGVTDIAAARGLKEATVVDHLEKLMESGRIGKADCAHLALASKREHAKREIADAFEEHGVGALKPVYQHTNGVFDYDTLRLARFLYQNDLLS